MGIEAVVVLLLLLLPGILGDRLYRFLLWRREPSGESKIVRSVVFSALGILLIMVAQQFGFGSLPVYINPAWWEEAARGSAVFVEGAIPSWLYHILASATAALATVAIVSCKWTATLVSWIAKQSLYENAWQEFAESYFERYVLLTTQQGITYYGQLGVVSGDDDRSVVLWNPAEYQAVDGKEMIEVTGTEAVYIPQDQIASIRVSYPSGTLYEKRDIFGKYDLKTGERII